MGWKITGATMSGPMNFFGSSISYLPSARTFIRFLNCAPLAFAFRSASFLSTRDLHANHPQPPQPPSTPSTYTHTHTHNDQNKKRRSCWSPMGIIFHLQQ